jgi:DNA modification methylase
MPTLTWPGKSPHPPAPSDLVTESILYPRGNGYPDVAAQDRLLLGDNLGIMTRLVEEYAGRVDLIYADPPFFSRRDYPARIGRGEDSRRPQDWKLAEGYADRFASLDAYLDFLYPRLALMQRLLSPNGTIYLHLDWHADAYGRLLLDELFGQENLLNEIIWTYHGPSPIQRAFNRKHDTILAYSKGKAYTFNADAVREPYHPNTVKTFDSPKAGFGKVPDLARGKVPEDWWYFPVVARLHRERTGYPTQKPEALLERILLASSNPGDLVADFFCGSGTFPLVAARHGRSFLACDNQWRSTQTCLKRLAAEASLPVSIEHESGLALPTERADLGLEIGKSSVQIREWPELDYWEVDPDWNGTVFRSAGQACRSNRSAEIPLKIDLPVALKNLCVRAVTQDGDRLELHV